jgi:hypothetical protein
MIKKTLLGSLVVTTVLVGWQGAASAEPRQGDTYGTIGAELHYGIPTWDPDVNPFGFGLGARAGGTFGPGVYVGVDFDYFFGEENNANAFGIVAASARQNVYHLLAEVGYDAWVYREGVLRPKLGLGIGFYHGGGCVTVNVPILGAGSGCTGDTTNGFDLAPALQFLHFFGAGFITAELGFETMIVDGPNPSAVILSLGGGAGF